MAEKTLHLLNGTPITIDGKMQTLLLELYRAISLDKKMIYSTEQLAGEMKALVNQLSSQQKENYLVQSLIINFKFFEKELIKEAYQKQQQSNETIN